MRFSIVERLARVNRWVGMAIVAGFSVILIATGIFLTRGDDASGDAAPEWMEAVPGEPVLGPDGLPVVPNATLIAESVAATIEALPTATPIADAGRRRDPRGGAVYEPPECPTDHPDEPAGLVWRHHVSFPYP